MSAYTEFFLKCPRKIIEYELLEISHPNFTKTYRIVRNKVGGLTATVDGSPQTFDYYPLRITSRGTRADLDYALQITLGDLGTIIPVEMDAIAAAGGFQTEPKVRYWTFSSADLTTPLFGPITLQVTEFQTAPEGATFEAHAASLNNNRTGENYLPSRFEMLQGLI